MDELIRDTRVIIIIIISLVLHSVFGWNNSRLLPENHLRRNLFRDYDPNVLPVSPDRKKLDIKVQVILKSLDDVDIRSKTATISVIFNVAWKNHQLAWNGSDYDSIDYIFAKASEVWVPQLSQKESGKTLSSKSKQLLKIARDGRCTFPMINQVVGKCNTDIKKYPNDVHTCTFSFYSYNVMTSTGNVILSMINEGQETINGAWILSKTARKERFFYYAGFKMELNITRKPQYTKRKISIPLVLLSCFSVLSHMLPVETGERVGFSITALLTTMLTIQYAMEKLPEADDEPDIVYYGRLNLFFMMISLLMTTIILNLFHKRRSEMPRKAKKILKFVCRFFFVKYSSDNSILDIKLTENEQLTDWIILSRVLDRVCILVFTFLMFMTILSVY